MMEVTITWRPEMAFEAATGSGHTVLMDGPPEHGGTNQGPRPMELMLAGLGGCSAFDVVHILKKARHAVVGCEANIRATRADQEPKVFESIHLHFVVTGHHLKDMVVERAVRLSAEKYCSASIMMERAGAAVTHSFEIIEAK